MKPSENSTMIGKLAHSGDILIGVNMLNSHEQVIIDIGYLKVNNCITHATAAKKKIRMAKNSGFC